MGEIIVALNTNNREQALKWVDVLSEHVKIFKIGLPLFSKYGPGIVEEVKKKGVRVFLDMKLHDIPSVVGQAVESLRDLEIDFVTIHLSGGREMAMAALSAAEGKVEIIGVTVLTSVAQKEFGHLYGTEIEKVVEKMVEDFVKIGGSNVVLSGREAPEIKRKYGIRVFVPGIRPSFAVTGDQSRVVTPEFAKKHGFDYIIVGRPITHSEDPVKSLLEIRREFYGV